MLGGVASTNDNLTQPTLQTLLAKAIRLGADEIELEYFSEGLQVVYVHGQTGAGDVIASHEATRAIIDDLFERAKHERKDRGGFKWAYAGVEHMIRVQTYDSFGESAFRLTFKKPAHAR